MAQPAPPPPPEIRGGPFSQPPGELVLNPSAPHLGGYVKGGDEATYYPQLWEYLVKYHEVKSVLDVGCGDGQALDFFEQYGVEVIGLDGMPQSNEKIIEHDFTKGGLFDHSDSLASDERLRTKYDLVWSCEFVEHVEERYLSNILSVFQLAPLVLLTHADVGQQGYHHVNCQSSDYWRGVMAAEGYRYDQDLTAVTRAYSEYNKNPHNHYSRSGLAFRRYE